MATPDSHPYRLSDLLPAYAVEALAAEMEEARAADALGYLARVMVQATLPHTDPQSNEFRRTNGLLSLSVLAPSHVGIPYGSLPRLLLAWLTTEAVRTRSAELVLGPSLSSFMQQLDLTPTGGRWGTIPRLRKQMTRLFSSSISCTYNDAATAAGQTMAVARSYSLWWDPKQPQQAALWQSTVTLSTDFFEEIVRRPVPVDLGALRALKRSPLALDLYAWLTYRFSYLRQPTTIPWEALQLQFGSDYGRCDNFQRKVVQALQNVARVYPTMRCERVSRGLQLHPSPTHVRKLS